MWSKVKVTQFFLRTPVSCQQSDCETGTQLTDIVEGRLEDKEDRRHTLTAQYNKNGTCMLEMCCAKYTHRQESNEQAAVTCGSVPEQLCFLHQVSTSTSPSHTAQQPPITEAILYQEWYFGMGGYWTERTASKATVKTLKWKSQAFTYSIAVDTSKTLSCSSKLPTKFPSAPPIKTDHGWISVFPENPCIKKLRHWLLLWVLFHVFSHHNIALFSKHIPTLWSTYRL